MERFKNNLNTTRPDSPVVDARRAIHQCSVGACLHIATWNRFAIHPTRSCYFCRVTKLKRGTEAGKHPPSPRPRVRGSVASEKKPGTSNCDAPVNLCSDETLVARGGACAFRRPLRCERFPADANARGTNPRDCQIIRSIWLSAVCAICVPSRCCSMLHCRSIPATASRSESHRCVPRPLRRRGYPTAQP